jgi:hypothetical protein
MRLSSPAPPIRRERACLDDEAGFALPRDDPLYPNRVNWVLLMHPARSGYKNDTQWWRRDVAIVGMKVCCAPLQTRVVYDRVPGGLQNGQSRRPLQNTEMTKPWIIPFVVAIGLVLALSACTNPYDPVQRTIGGGLIGAGSGAAIGAAAAGGHGAALGAAVGGAVGAVAGLITTPPPPAYHGYYNHRRYASYNRRRHHCVDCRHAVASTATAAPANAPSGY